MCALLVEIKGLKKSYLGLCCGVPYILDGRLCPPSSTRQDKGQGQRDRGVETKGILRVWLFLGCVRLQGTWAPALYHILSKILKTALQSGEHIPILQMGKLRPWGVKTSPQVTRLISEETQVETRVILNPSPSLPSKKRRTKNQEPQGRRGQLGNRAMAITQFHCEHGSSLLPSGCTGLLSDSPHAFCIWCSGLCAWNSGPSALPSLPLPITPSAHTSPSPSSLPNASFPITAITPAAVQPSVSKVATCNHLVYLEFSYASVVSHCHLNDIF